MIEGSPFILQPQYIARVQFSSLIHDNYNKIDLSAFDCINSSLSKPSLRFIVILGGMVLMTW